MPAYRRAPDFSFIRMRPKLGWEKVGEVKEKIAHVIRNTHDTFS